MEKPHLSGESARNRGSGAMQSISIDLSARFAEARRIESEGNISGALDIVYRSLDNTLRLGNFRVLDEFIRKLKPEELSIDMIISVLVLSRPASDEIKSREDFFERAWKSVESRKRNARELLGGLRYGPKAACPVFVQVGVNMQSR